MDNPSCYVIIQTGFIGDIALALYTAHELRIAQPTCTIVMVTTPVGYELIAAFPTIVDHCIIYDKRQIHKGMKGVLQCSQKIASYKPSAILCIHQSFRTTLLSFLTFCSTRIGFSSSSLSILHSHKVYYRKDCHEIERNAELLAPLSLASHPFQPSFQVPKLLDAKQTIDIGEKKYIVIAPGSVWATKRWPASKFSLLIESILAETDYSIVLIGSNNDSELCSSIYKGNNKRVVNTAGTMSLGDTTALIQQARLLIANDSAPIHLASLVNCATIAIFGPTHPAFGFAPIASNSVVIQKEMKCRPCSIHGQALCPMHHHLCMEGISVEEVFGHIMSFHKNNHFHVGNP